MTSNCSLVKLPPELRIQIFLDVLTTESCSKSLLIALRPTHKYSTLYNEAIEAYYQVRTCTISIRNKDFTSKLYPGIRSMLRVLHIEFFAQETFSSPVRFKKVYEPIPNNQGGLASVAGHVVPVRYLRIFPRPTFETIAPFANIQCLSLNAASVPGTRFHQIEGIVEKAVRTLESLERVEVISDIASVKWEYLALLDEVKADPNYLWIARLNKGMRIKAKLKVVDTLGLSWPWFWQAPRGKTLSWRG